MAQDKKSFLLYCDLIHTVTQMPDDKAGVLFKHVLAYVNDLSPETDDLIVQLCFEPIKQQLKRDLLKYNKLCAKNKENIRKRWDSKHTPEYDPIPSDTKHTDTVTGKGTGKGTVTGKENDTDILNKEEPKGSLGESQKINYQEIVDIFNSVCTGLPKVVALSHTRKNLIRIRANDHGLESMGTVFNKTRDSNFLNGDNGNNWKASFDWVMKASNYIKILEDNYKNKSNNNGRFSTVKKTGVSDDYLQEIYRDLQSDEQ